MRGYQEFTTEELSNHFLLAAKDEDSDKDQKEKIKEKKKEVKKNVDKAEKEAKETGESVGEQAQSWLKQIDLANPSWDMFVVLFFIAGALLYGFSLGRDRIIVILVSIYMALAVVHAIPDFILDVSFNNSFAFQITTFISVFVVLFFLISRSALLRTIGQGASRGKWYQTVIFSFMHVGLLISIAMSFLPPNLMQKFAPLTQTIFTNEWAMFAWIAAPIAAMVIFGSKSED